MFDYVMELSGERDEIKINSIFQRVVDDLHSFLLIDPKIHQIKITLDNSSTITQSEIIHSVGVHKEQKDDKITIIIDMAYLTYIPLIILREAYILFIPTILKNYKSIHLVINNIIVANLSKFEFIHKWKALVAEKINTTYDSHYLPLYISIFGRLEKIFTFFEQDKESLSPIRFFFQHISKFDTLIQDTKEDMGYILDEFHAKKEVISKKVLHTEEMVETLYCLVSIFYNVKTYKAFAEYQTYFKQFKEEGKIITSLSMRKFVKHMNWIKKFTHIAPTYQLNWNAINAHIIMVFLSFNPNIKRSRILTMLKQLPFFLAPRFVLTGLGINVTGFIVIPKVYLTDFLEFISKLEKHGYLMNHACIDLKKYYFLMNLNYFREFHAHNSIINPYLNIYDDKYEFTLEVNPKEISEAQDLSLLDFLILDRIRFISAYGFGFESRKKDIPVLKSDLMNAITDQQSLIKNLKEKLSIFSSTPETKQLFLSFLERNKKFGFFYIKNLLEDILNCVLLIENSLSNHPEISSMHHFQRFIKHNSITASIDNNIILASPITTSMYHELFSLYFSSPHLYKKEVSMLQLYQEIFDLCYQLKILDFASILHIISHESAREKIYNSKEKKLSQSYENYKMQNITSQVIDEKIKFYLDTNPPTIIPKMAIGTDSYNYSLLLILKDSLVVRNKAFELKKFFPMATLFNARNLITGEKTILLEEIVPYLTDGEFMRLCMIVHNIFRDDIIYFRPQFWIGWVPASTLKHFYDLTENKFFYTPALFKEFFIYTQKIFGNVEASQTSKISQKTPQSMWLCGSADDTMAKLITDVNRRIKKERYNTITTDLHLLQDLNNNINQYIFHPQDFNKILDENVVKQHVDSIQFKPSLKSFGVDQCYMFIRMNTMNGIDFKELISTTFQSVRCTFPSCEDSSLLIKFLHPSTHPHARYLEQLRSLNIIIESCVFSVKKLYQVLHFASNITSEGLEYNINYFKIHMQKSLFDPSFIPPAIKTSSFEDVKTYKFDTNSPPFNHLIELCSAHDIKMTPFQIINHKNKMNKIVPLLEKKMLIPLLKIKNFGLHNKVHIILPDLSRRQLQSIIRVFQFFNIVKLYEIEGDYFISGFSERKTFMNGLFIKLYFPDINWFEFLEEFEKLFDYLDIPHYAIITNLTKENGFVERVYGPDFLKSYNPLKNIQFIL